MEQLDGVEIVAFTDAEAFESWLAEHHTRHEGVWIKVAKKKSGIPTVTDDELVDIGLCYGWISGQRRSYNEQAAGRMREPGLAEVRRAQEDGRWAGAYESQKTATVPPDLAAALDANPEAKTAFEALDRTGRYLVILPLLQALTPENRRVRLEKALRMLVNTSA
ncbi:YdeI/OmpD-associated family protein [Streptomyces sp. ISL-99]|uniref:YdeI/OmpD-associated family protein n=1 Tax=Streptomyces sp. ISL-99 TaxID=2819193 RepID=UPI001BE7EDD5|nr:YdeI/OmpD-associated family protein [Streptomyces sp. ISL-99]MBT2527251.1 YdeI/OmpD-associated family protein [Streptomyces sp. ISL-99]